MITNPPHIFWLLRVWKAADKIHRAVGIGPLPAHGLVPILVEYLGHPTWEEFRKTYNLYLQQIPFALAREAWGIAHAAQASASLKTDTQSHP